LSIKRLPSSIPFDHQQAGGHVLVGRKALVATLAFPAAADRLACVASVDYFVIFMPTVRTVHRSTNASKLLLMAEKEGQRKERNKQVSTAYCVEQ